MEAARTRRVSVLILSVLELVWGSLSRVVGRGKQPESPRCPSCSLILYSSVCIRELSTVGMRVMVGYPRRALKEGGGDEGYF